MLVAGLALLLVAGCGNGLDAQARAGDRKNYIAGDGAVTTVPAADRTAPVTITGTTLTGQALDISALRGSVVVLNVWGSWCRPCQQESPDLQKAWVTLQPKGVHLIGLVTRDATANALAFERANGITYPSLQDDGGRSLLALRGQVPPNAIPSTIVLDTRGRVAARVLGKVDATTLTGLVDDVLAQAS